MEGFGEHRGWQRVFLLCPWAFLGMVLESQVGGDVLSLAAGLLASPPPDSNGEAPSLSQATFWVPSLLVLPAFLLPPHHHQNWRGKDQRRSVLVAPNSLPVLGLPRIWRAGRRGRRSHELLLPPSPRTHTCCCFSPANCQFSATFLFPAPERK